MPKYLGILIIALLAFAGSSCRSSRQASASQNSLPAQNINSADGTQQWHDLYIPLRIRLNSPMSLSASGRATMVRDSLIHISMRVFGMEVAVINVTPQRVAVLDKFHKAMFVESLDAILGSHKMSLSEMQDLLLGMQEAEANELRFDTHGKKPVTVLFSQYAATPFGMMAGNVEISAPFKKGELNAGLVWDTSKAEWNTARSVQFSLPEDYRSYSKDNIQELLKSF